MVQGRWLSFTDVASQLDGLLQQLLQGHPHDPRNLLPRTGGVYLFTEAGTHLYVGQTRDFRTRYRNHLAGQEHQSHFAFNLARDACARLKVTVTGTRKQIATSPTFAPYFADAVRRVRGMEFRYVVVTEPAVRTVFEVYAALELKTLHNSFETH
jgi:predicted GIY-YIG superfamily endonuclease